MPNTRVRKNAMPRGFDLTKQCGDMANHTLRKIVWILDAIIGVFVIVYAWVMYGG